MQELFAQLVSGPYWTSGLPPGVKVTGVARFDPADGPPARLVDMTLQSDGARYHVLYDLQDGTSDWAANVLWKAMKYDATASGRVLIPQHLGHGAICSYADLGAAGRDMSCAALVNGVLLQVQAPIAAATTSGKAKTLVAMLRSCMAHVTRLHGA